ncbi:LOW QUALITY PROTEIN: uncharacterized protein LOC120284164 [Dioscorea cayenensis subsp. rotundata]|uniref:LOW QUALITY PROTEIN: uncharacterized protein LOC120284164 n=1 Tax=Dioscorea cayennensis subsp. rotundata TaxID=55577 RepID=A0AB40D644_DIOCR|nr:LOW QUALITY PROTEIN: uncharacterized protein LOC120284164 [Dioscorea cayenensis subsp. rotundata]
MATKPEQEKQEHHHSWEQKLQALTHILTHPTSTPSLHSQLFIASRVPCFLFWDYPPFLCSPNPPMLHWVLSLFFSRVSTFGLPAFSWRSSCPFLQPPPPFLSPAVVTAPVRWGSEERRDWARRRLRRGQLGLRLHPFVVISVPNLVLLALLLYDPLWLRSSARNP